MAAPSKVTAPKVLAVLTVAVFVFFLVTKPETTAEFFRGVPVFLNDSLQGLVTFFEGLG